MPCAGNFADVYKVHCPITRNTWAVKFFKREVRKDGDGLAKSAADVRVYYKGGKGEVFRVPAKATGPLWDVLDVAVDPAGKITIALKKDLFDSKLPE